MLNGCRIPDGAGVSRKISVYTITHILQNFYFFFFSSGFFCIQRKQRKQPLIYIAQYVYTCLQNDPIVYTSFLILGDLKNVQACQKLV